MFEEDMPNKNNREYLLTKTASCLDGEGDPDFILDNWLGDGGNGKSCVDYLIGLTLGDYYCVLPTDILTTGSQLLLQKSIRKRLIVFREMQNNSDANTEILKNQSSIIFTIY